MKNLINRKKIIILLIIQTAIFIYFLTNFFTLKTFKNDFIKNYQKDFPMKAGVYVSNLLLEEDFENKDKQILNFINYIKTNDNIKNYRINVIEFISRGELGIKYSAHSKEYKIQTPTEENNIPYLKFNYNYYYELKKYIHGPGFKISDFNHDQDIKPIILGRNFKGIYNIGDLIISADKTLKFKVVGFFNRNISILDGDPILNAQSLDNGIVTPLNKQEFNDVSKLRKILNGLTIEFKDEANIAQCSKIIKDKAKSLDLNIEFQNFHKPLNEFLKDFDSKLKFEFVRIIMFNILAFGALTLSFIYLVNTKKREIGILYSIGATTSNIIFTMVFDVMFIIISAYLISLPIYMYNGKIIFYFFVNQFSVRNFIWAFLTILITAFIALIIPCCNIIKLKPKELIGGFRE
ncbi:FtsX-like permease family protein [Clostridium botulinum]|nr:FtsX-like permease family protein [Clostridium botulinum]